MISEFLRLKAKVKNRTATAEEHRRYLTLLAKMENEKEGALSEHIKKKKNRWV